MDKPTPFSSVFKFREPKQEHVEQLRELFLWFAKPDSFEDEQEGAFEFNDELTMSDIVRYLKRELSASGVSLIEAERLIARRIFDDDFKPTITRILRNYHDEQRDTAKAMYHLSLAANLKKCPQPEYNNLGNLHLWKVYGAEFEGFCIEFDADALSDSLKRLNPEAKITSQKVNYDDVVPSRALTEQADGLLFQYLRHYGRKRLEFEPEFELRLSSTREGKHYFDASVIKGIYLGGKMNTTLRDELSRSLPRSLPSVDIIEISGEMQNNHLPTRVIYKGTP